VVKKLKFLLAIVDKYVIMKLLGKEFFKGELL